METAIDKTYLEAIANAHATRDSHNPNPRKEPPMNIVIDTICLEALKDFQQRPARNKRYDFIFIEGNKVLATDGYILCVLKYTEAEQKEEVKIRLPFNVLKEILSVKPVNKRLGSLQVRIMEYANERYKYIAQVFHAHGSCVPSDGGILKTILFEDEDIGCVPGWRSAIPSEEVYTGDTKYPSAEDNQPIEMILNTDTLAKLKRVSEYIAIQPPKEIGSPVRFFGSAKGYGVFGLIMTQNGEELGDTSKEPSWIREKGEGK